MRCTICNVALSDKESCFKHPVSNEYLDTCFKCLPDILPSFTNDLDPDVEYDDQVTIEQFDEQYMYAELLEDEGHLSSDDR